MCVLQWMTITPFAWKKEIIYKKLNYDPVITETLEVRGFPLQRSIDDCKVLIDKNFEIKKAINKSGVTR